MSQRGGGRDPRRPAHGTWLLAGLAALAVVAAAVYGFTRAPGARVGRDRPTVEVDVISRQFAWEPATITVPQGARVRLRVRSADVTHGVGIFDHGINRQIPGGQTVTVEFVADRAGRFPIYCTVFCGVGHADHRGWLIVEP